MDELRKSLYNVESGINSLCAHLAEVAQHGSRDVRDNLIEVLRKLVSGEIVATVFADFSKPGLRKIFVIGDTNEAQMKALRAFEAELDKQHPAPGSNGNPAKGASGSIGGRSEVNLTGLQL